MLALRTLTDLDVPMVEGWLHQEHVKKWYEIPHMGVTLDDWMDELNARHGEYHWLTHLIASWDGQPIGLCQYYSCKDSDEKSFGDLPLDGAYGIDYLIGDPAFVGKGLGRGMITLLVERIFSFPDAKRVTADIDKNNKASEGALRSCGFVLCDAEQSRYVLEKTPAL